MKRLIRLTFRPVLVAITFAMLAVSCSGGTSGDGPSNAVNVAEHDFHLVPSVSSARSGTVTFDITNRGPSVHEFVVVRTDLPAEELPTDLGFIHEDTPGLKMVDEKGDIRPGTQATLTLKLPAGRYVFVCNIPGHYLFGMHASFTVS